MQLRLASRGGRVGGEYYCRSIQKMNADGSLSFFCAIDDGIVLSIARAHGMVESTRDRIRGHREAAGRHRYGLRLRLRAAPARRAQPAGIPRHVGALPRQQRHRLRHLSASSISSMHLNQTLTGIAFGLRPRSGRRRGRIATAPCRSATIDDIDRLKRINEALISRVERSMEQQGNAFSLFQTAINLESRVRARTEELRATLRQARAVEPRARRRQGKCRARQPVEDAVPGRREPRRACSRSTPRIFRSRRWPNCRPAKKAASWCARSSARWRRWKTCCARCSTFPSWMPAWCSRRSADVPLEPLFSLAEIGLPATGRQRRG